MQANLTIQQRQQIVLCLALVLSLAVAFLPALPQDLHYHQFADQRDAWGLANFSNVLSNLPFILVGIYGFWRCRTCAASPMLTAYQQLSLASLLIAAGSAWYHLAPSNATLFWDRLPITLGFMAVTAMVWQERVWQARSLLLPLQAAGCLACVYWYVGEMSGAGDLRPYLLVQFLPVLLLPLVLYLFPSRYLRDRFLWLALLLYAIAKLCESQDAALLELLGFSGHSIKHLLAALAMWAMVQAADFTNLRSSVHDKSASLAHARSRITPI